ncbi:17.6 kDa class I heat shock protein [Euphorbia peplus]|nr:17.6 kDa class I heat shock protein [Euphorbia peplus]
MESLIYSYYHYQQPFPWHYIFPSPQNHVHWSQTPESHIFSADLPGVKKEEIKVEVENSLYMIIRTEGIDESSNPGKTFLRKFRLPGMVDLDGISAGYEDGVLTVTVPRSYMRRGLIIDSGADMADRLQVAARAA